MRVRRPLRRAERGITMIFVLVLLTVMLLGALALARMTEVGTLASGNAAYREAAIQASEIGVDVAFKAVNAIGDEEGAVGVWYTPQERDKDADGLPTGFDWGAMPSTTVGQTTVRYVVERACSVAAVQFPLRQCLVKQIPQPKSQVAGAEELDPPNSRQFRITVQVTDAKGTQTYVQALVTKG